MREFGRQCLDVRRDDVKGYHQVCCGHVNFFGIEVQYAGIRFLLLAPITNLTVISKGLQTLAVRQSPLNRRHIR